MDHTARLNLPLLTAGQSLKELFHNEALQQLEILLSPVVEGMPVAAPPAEPAIGDCWIVAEEAAGDWAGRDGSIACFTTGGWRYVAPFEGMQVADRGSGATFGRRGDAWELGIVRAEEVKIDGETVLRGRQPAIPDPAGGSVADAECRAAVAAMLAAMRAHGLIG